ncbi:MAG: DUF3887 domain-containing protein [Bellilinea sp.]
MESEKKSPPTTKAVDMKAYFSRIKILASTVIFLLAAGCSLVRAPLIEPRVLEDAEQQKVLDYAAPASENVLAGLIARDYSQFSRDFSDAMKVGMDEAAFNELLSMLDSKLGAYQSSNLVTVLQDENYSTVVYRLTYEKDDQVTMRVVFDRSDPHLISGLWFDSPELRGP